MKRHSPETKGCDDGKSHQEGWTRDDQGAVEDCHQLADQYGRHSRESYDEFSFAAHALIPCRLV